MKKILLIGVLFQMLSVNAQNSHRFADSTAQWKVNELFYLFPSGQYSDVANYSVQGDTVLNNKTYQMISPSYDETYLYFVRVDSTAKVYSYLTYYGVERVSFDFSLDKGDRISLPKRPYSSGFTDTIKLIVDSVDTVQYGSFRKRMFMKSDTVNNANYRGWEDIWVSGIGSFKSFFLNPFFHEFEPEGSAYCLNSFQEKSFNISFISSCIVSIDQVHELTEMIYPNPASNVLTIAIDDYKNQSIHFHDLLGKEIYIQEIENAETTIDVSNWHTGIYFYQIMKDGVKSQGGKLVVE